MSLNDLYAQYDRPNCCEQGDKYIWWSIDETGCEDESKRGFTWWVMEAPFSQGQSWFERVNHCPFCGYDLGFGKARLEDDFGEMLNKVLDEYADGAERKLAND